MDPLVVPSMDSTAALPQEGSHSLEYTEVFSKHIKAAGAVGDSFFTSEASSHYFPYTSDPSQNTYFANKLHSLNPLVSSNCVPSSKCAGNNSVNIPCNITLSVASADWTAQLNRCINKLVNRMEAQRLQLLQLNSRLNSPYAGMSGAPSVHMMSDPKGEFGLKNIDRQLMSNRTFPSDPMSPGHNVSESLQYKERLEQLQVMR